MSDDDTDGTDRAADEASAQVFVDQITVGQQEYAVASVPQPKPEAAFEPLTKAEAQVAILVFEGMSNQEIADERQTAVRTVANQLASVFDKLGVGSRAELVRLLAEVVDDSGSSG